MHEIKKALIMLAALFAASPILAKPVALEFQTEGMIVEMQQGAQVIMSQKSGSTVLLKAPDAKDGNRFRVSFVFLNNTKQRVNIGSENLSSSPFYVITYERLLAEVRSHEKSQAFIAALGSVGRSLSASGETGYRYEDQSYRGYIDCGIGCSATYRGTGKTRTYDPNLVKEAQERARRENEASARNLEIESELARSALSSLLRTTTLAPGQSHYGVVTFEIPKAVTRGKVSVPFNISVGIGDEFHNFSGYIGPVGAPRATASSPLKSGQQLPVYSGDRDRSSSNGYSALATPSPQAGVQGKASSGTSLTPENCSQAAPALAEAYGLLGRGEKNRAQVAFRQFLSGCPNASIASEASLSWGRVLLGAKMPASAAKIFYETYNLYPKQNSAAESLILLAEVLYQLDHVKESCDALYEFSAKFFNNSTEGQKNSFADLFNKCKKNTYLPKNSQ